MGSSRDMGSDQGRPHRVICYIGREETNGLGLGEQRQRRKSVDSAHDFLASVTNRLSGLGFQVSFLSLPLE